MSCLGPGSIFCGVLRRPTPLCFYSNSYWMPCVNCEMNVNVRAKLYISHYDDY